jgi:hypothetical protein
VPLLFGHGGQVFNAEALAPQMYKADLHGP